MQALSKNTVRFDIFLVGPHAQILRRKDLDKTQLERKIRLLTLTSLAFQHVGQNVPYSKIAEVLQVDVSEVEQWVIDGNVFFYIRKKSTSLTSISSQSSAPAWSLESFPRPLKRCTFPGLQPDHSKKSNGRLWRRGFWCGRLVWQECWR